MNAPAVVIRLELEAAPLVYVDTLRKSDANRLKDWLQTHDEYGALVARAMELAKEARAA